jgi:NAD(P)-dependent dehydrogenase (short-subunit alcohol dehydrogenase family)
MTVASDCARLLRTAGPIDGLAVAHGDTTGQPVDAVTADDWDRLFNANLRSVFFLLQATARRLPGNGAVVLLASTAAKTGAIPEVRPMRRPRRVCCRSHARSRRPTPLA